MQLHKKDWFTWYVDVVKHIAVTLQTQNDVTMQCVQSSYQ